MIEKFIKYQIVKIIAIHNRSGGHSRDHPVMLRNTGEPCTLTPLLLLTAVEEQNNSKGGEPMEWKDPVMSDFGSVGPCHCPSNIDGPCSGGNFDEPRLNLDIHG